MSKKTSTGWITLAVVVVAGAAAGGYWLGHSAVPRPVAAVVPAPAAVAEVPAEAAKAERTVLYYKDPTGKPEFSPDPKKDAAGRDFVPVYSDEESAAAATPSAAPPSPAAVPQDRGKILYYRNPMGLADTSPVPKKDPMGMAYVAVYENDESGPTVNISPDRIQKLGVRTEAVGLRRLTHTVRAVGTVQVDERRVQVVAPKFEGYAENLHVDTTGQAVRQGESLMEVYSPDLVLAQQEYLAAWKASQDLPADASQEARESALQLADGGLQRLRNWDISDAQVRRLKQVGRSSRTLSLSAPSNGVVLEKNVVRGQRFMPGEVLYRIADLSNVWVIADVFEQELSYVAVGEDAKVTFNALPGRSYSGKVTFIYPTLSPETRTARVRIEMPNPDQRLKPALYGSVDIASQAGDRDVVVVPDSALLDSGTRKVVLVEKGEGRFEPRDVKTGMHADGYVEITDGIAAGEKVVVSANFLIDAESNLRAALQGFQAPAQGDAKK
ncbi:efflux RND transporter periplasmic adaptor subunit [Telmatospirillum sp.]|uniref:efflux RND transporter periplasmic adaptor subunit n=1 Tax=Telmatospirillum sp. TaxID=2079197 RepID=UPI0028498426|nr:efflux RND transporter periplasmic adaptor subunit [Telmatospirillum sp.]MDR3435769.1 efflux RND transporter periplasmic adaptor subunit [Telmatospirillum sp.]